MLSKIPRGSEHGYSFWTKQEDHSEFQSWIMSSSNLIISVVPKDNPIRVNLTSVLEDNHYVRGSSVPSSTLQKVFGLLKSAYEEMKHGLFKKFEYLVMAETFDDFLDHAEKFHKANQKKEAAILAAIVFEDSIKKIAKKNGIETNQTLDPLIKELIKAEVFNAIEGKRITGYVPLRNSALHANWEEFDIKNVGEFIKATKSIIENFLA